MGDEESPSFFDSDEGYYEGDYKPLDDSTKQYEVLDVHIAARKRLQSELEKVVLQETGENSMLLADQVVLIGTDCDFVLTKSVMNKENIPQLAYALFAGLIKYIKTEYECSVGDVEEVFGAMWEDYYFENGVDEVVE